MGSKVIADKLQGLTDEDVIAIPSGVPGVNIQGLFGRNYQLNLYSSDLVLKNPWVDIRAGGASYTQATLEAAISLVSSQGGTLFIPPGSWVVDSDLTIPSHINLKFECGGGLYVNPGVDLTIDGTIQAGAWKIFEGGGSVYYSETLNSVVYSNWFGGTGVKFHGSISFTDIPYGPSGVAPAVDVDLANKDYVDNTLSASLSAAGVIDVGIIEDIRPQGTAYGSVTGDSSQTRTLNTVASDLGDVITSLSSNEFTLKAGTYLIDADVRLHKHGESKLVLYNVSDVEVAFYGKNELAQPGGEEEGGHARLLGVVVVPSEKTYRIEQYIDNSSGITGGSALNITGLSEKYAQVAIIRIG